MSARISRVPAVVVWGDETAAEKYAYQIDNDGSEVALIDHYGRNGRGSGRAAIVNGKSLKGVGVTPLAGRGYYGTGKLPLSEALTEAKWLRVFHQHHPDAIDAHAVLKIEGHAPYNLSHLSDEEIADIPLDWRGDSASILVRDEPIRFAHFEASDTTNAENLQFCKEKYGLPYADDYEFAEIMLRQCLERKFYWFFRRVHTGSVSLDNIDIFGNVFDLPLTCQLPDFRNVHACSHNVGFWDGDYLDSHTCVAGYVADNLLPNTTQDERDAAAEVTFLIVDSLNQEIFHQQALALLGFDQAEIAELVCLDAALVDRLGNAIITYIRKGTNISSGYNGIQSRWCGAEELYRNVGFIGENDFRLDFPMIVSGGLAGGYELGLIGDLYNSTRGLVGFNPDRLNNCFDICEVDFGK